MASIAHCLAVRSDFSIGESTLRVEKLVSRAKELGYDSVALVDTMSISAVVEFTKRAKDAGIKPIMGCVLRVYDNPKYRNPAKASGEKAIQNRTYNLKAYIRNEQGLKSLLKLLTDANSEEQFYYNARCGIDDVLSLEGVAISTGDLFSVFHHPAANNIMERLAKKFGKHFFVEYVPIKTPLFDTLNEKAWTAIDLYGFNAILTRPVFYSEEADAGSLDVLRAITSNGKMGSRTLPIPYIRDFCFKGPKTLYAGVDAAIVKKCLVGMNHLVDSIEYSFSKMAPSLPVMAENEFLALTQQVAAGWKRRFSQDVMGHTPAVEDHPIYKARLTYELGTLRKMGFSGYFLLVQNIVNWSRENGIIVGPGRGSAAGSLVSYMLGITDVDPIRFNLIFERFINPDRLDLPDIDLDFMSSRRGDVVEYISNHFGAENVAGISNYSTLGAASALRDSSRVHDLNPIEYSCSKQMEKLHGNAMSLEESALSVPDIQKFKNERPIIWEHATRLEGVMRNMGQHAAGVVVAGEPLINRAVVETRKGGAVVNWDKRSVEDLGLIKMDILGLSTLDVLNLAKQYVKERHGKTIDTLRLPIDNAKVLKAFGDGFTVGVFQYESGGMRKLLKGLADAGPLTFDDLVAVVALYRPGPLDAGLCDDYVAIRQGSKTPYYEHDNMIPALIPTHGVIVYQEQIMQIARDVAGFTMTEADHLRKAMGKKDREAMAKQRDKWVAGCVSHSSMDEGLADDLFGKVEVFAGYAFNLSHSVVYTTISYWAMWYKVMYPAEFYAATISVVDEDIKLTALVMDSKLHGIEIMPPDINISTGRIEIQGEKHLYAPFQAVKGISDNVANHILTVRAAHGKPFESVEDFNKAATAAVAGKINKSHKEKLERVGAFASVMPDSLPALHLDRLKDRIELMAGLTVDAVKADRGINNEKLNLIKLMRVVEETRNCTKCSLKCEPHAIPRMGKSPKFMVVYDSPSWKEAKAGKMFEGDTAAYFKAALSEVGMTPNDGYFTSLVKAQKPTGEKLLSNEAIINCSEYLKQEIEILKPAVIIAMGGNAIRYFAPGTKGSTDDLVGKAIFDKALDASIIMGFNIAQLAFNPGKAPLLQTVCSKIDELVN